MPSHNGKTKKATIALIVLLTLSTFFFCTMWLLERKGAEGIKTELEWIHVLHVGDMAQMNAENRYLLDTCAK